MPDDRNPEVERAETSLDRSGQVFLAEIERLAELERRKQEMAPDDEARLDVAHQVEGLVMDLTMLSRYQTRLVALESQSLGVDAGDERSTPAILEAWRAAERRLHETRMAMERASDDADRLRAEHRRSMLRER
jgi:hypothetical protein